MKRRNLRSIVLTHIRGSRNIALANIAGVTKHCTRRVESPYSHVICGSPFLANLDGLAWYCLP